MSSIDQQGSSLGSFPTSQVPEALRGNSAAQVWILRYRGCIHITATSSGRFNTFFFSTNRLATRLNPTSCGRFTLFVFASICTKGSACPSGHAALKAQVSLQLPLRYLRSAKITLILTAASWPVPRQCRALARNSLSYRPICLHSFGAKQP